MNDQQHPIENLMLTAMNSIKDMVDVNTIIGEPIETSNNTIIIPISKVGFGFAAGGSEFKGETIDEYTKREKEEARIAEEEARIAAAGRKRVSRPRPISEGGSTYVTGRKALAEQKAKEEAAKRAAGTTNPKHKSKKKK